MKRVVAYCRVSTDNENQSNSLENQKRYFSDYIRANNDWKLVEIYVDEGITGTSTKKRKDFNRMIDDARNNKFDMIITKEISRFARNTLDSIFYTRMLKDLGIGVVFVNDNINTLDCDAELRLTIMSSIAQEESRKISQRVKWGQKRSMEQGVVFGRDMLGYDVKDGNLIINEDGAKTVRLIFHKYTNEGKGTHTIAKELREEGVKTSTYMKQWSSTVILRVLRNEKYCGDLVQKKTYTPSYLNHEKKYNNGEEDFIIIRNHHEPIISREMFEKTQQELNKRSPSDIDKSKYSNRYCLSGKIKCANCQSSYVARTKKKDGEIVYKYWRCFENTKNGRKRIDKQGNIVGCDNKSVNENDIKNALKFTIKNIVVDKENVIDDLCSLIKRSIIDNNNDNTLKQLENKFFYMSQKRQQVIELYLNKDISKIDMQVLLEKYDAEISNLKRECCKVKENIDSNNEKLLFDEIEDTVECLLNGEIWNDIFYRNIIDKIIVYENRQIKIMLNGLSNDDVVLHLE